MAVQESRDGAGGVADQARRSMAEMRQTKRCSPPGHSWSSKTGLETGAPCQCGETVMDQSMRDALDWRCEPWR